MSIFKTALRVLWGHRTYVLIYLVLVDLLGVAMGMSVAQPEPASDASVSRATTTVAVIDRDKSDISAALARYVESQGEVVSLEDDLRAIQDATAKDRINYILVIPAGYGQDLMRAADAGMDAPELERVVSYASSQGSLMDVNVTSYLQALYGFASTLGGTQAQVADRADTVMEHEARVSYVKQEAQTIPEALMIYCRFSTYPLFASITVCLALLMSRLNEPAVRRRMRASSVTAASYSRQLLLVCLVAGLVAWGWVCVMGLVFFGLPVLKMAPVQLGVIALALLAYALVAVALGFLFGQLGMGENASNAVANIGGMLMSFMGGAWVSLSLLPAAIVAVAHFVPSYWCMQAIDGASALPQVSGQYVAPLLASVGVCALFAVAIFMVALSVGKRRLQEA